jgi:hypothetical protein
MRKKFMVEMSSKLVTRKYNEDSGHAAMKGEEGATSHQEWRRK